MQQQPFYPADRRGIRPAQSGFVLGDLLSSIYRNWFVIILATVLGTAAAYPIAKNLPDRYAAQATLISEAGLSGIVALGSSDTPPIIDPSATTTIVETIGAAVVVERAIEALSPELLAQLVAEAGVEEALAEVQDPAAQERLRQPLIRRHLADNLEVINSGRSYVISVRYNSQDPDLAAAVANAVAEGYLVYRATLKHDAYTQMLGNLGSEIDTLKEELLVAERTAQTMREQVALLAARSGALAGRQQDEAIAENAALYAQQREAEREAEATAAVYERLLFSQREIQSRIGTPELDVQLFAPAVIPLQPSGFNAKPVLMALGLMGGFLLGISIGLLLDLRRSRAAVLVLR